MIILDTHIILWAYNNVGGSQLRKIPAKIRMALDSATELGVCDISLWEMAMLAQKGRITLPSDTGVFFQDLLGRYGVNLLPINPRIAAISGMLQMHGDPADRLIAATSVCYDYCLATVDGELRALDFLKTIQY